MDAVFDWCVDVLIYWAAVFGITYKEINVWVFVIIWPIVSLVMLFIIYRQWTIIRKYRKMQDINLILKNEENG